MSAKPVFLSANRLRTLSSPINSLALQFDNILGPERRTLLPGLFVLFLTLIALSCGVGMQPEHGSRLFMAGEIATADVVAPRNMQVEDTAATSKRGEQLADSQPTVYDLSPDEGERLRQKFLNIFRLVNGHITNDTATDDTNSLSASSEEKLPKGELSLTDESLIRQLREISGLSFSQENINIISRPQTQTYILNKALPWLETRLIDGVVSDTRGLRGTNNGILVRNLENGQESMRPDISGVSDISSLLTFFTQQLREDSSLNAEEKQFVGEITESMIMPSLSLNREATQNRRLMAKESAKPIYYRINKGELIVQRGERVSKEQELKLKCLFRSGKTFLRAQQTIGTIFIALLLASGLFISPSGKQGSPLHRRDLYFISFLLLLFGLGAKGLYLFSPHILEGVNTFALAFAFPVAGAAGLSALIFASRRYCVIGLLLSMFCTLLLNGGLPLFLFFFLSSMCNTWLIMRSQNRQDVVRSMLPLALTVIPMGFAMSMLDGFPADGALVLLICLVINVMLSQFLMFSTSPLLEMLFGYTTRFRLMELINLEQPLLQELMVNAPGTYHHSLVVSNMVEAGAKAIGANSLLCKVGALYHDIGKLAYPDYFIENQFGGPNRHDKLAPAMSALILISHVKKGVELASRYNLGEEIADMIRQHHGTNTMRFFYQRALELAQPDEVVRSEDFKYPGPRPQSREAAIIMLADMVEASSRTLTEPTPARIRTHIETIVRNIFADGQLDESALTFQDLHKLSLSFVRILTGIFHQRIVYPDMNKLKNPPAAGASSVSASSTPLPNTAQAV